MRWNQKIWQRSLDGFREGATLYVQGLLLPAERKSIEPMAERLGVDSQKLQQFIPVK